MQSRRIARELALLGMSQLTDDPKRSKQTSGPSVDTLLTEAIRTLTAEVKETLEAASAELVRGNRQLLDSETRSGDLRSAQETVKGAIEQVQTAINRLGAATELPEFVQLAGRKDIQDYSQRIITQLTQHRDDIDQQLDSAMVGWNLKRLARVDRDILRIALTEILYLAVDKRIAIDEAIEIAKRYSDEEGYRFINGVMRRVTDQLASQKLDARSTPLKLSKVASESSPDPTPSDDEP
ncbi:transcription antitermination protein NusB [Leptolyngbyaceae cyanobacterium CCMR0082]|uniref:Transcription antitermination protein NusB n=2 Tax=Adonisia turfae TaxID=2950184 RepID=A0A6M0SAB4_9CYAN|nr:transcription antitermination factor NusB [Adonisia turfae]MDV3350789.1 transcription antitermination factor NusB [Leptothoe sp. LEGE 181152]NEZ58724.1 transcription antitermination protein NusB [Adonisia turfae CCMR0081]NEZ65429.1 transcription antitermination protein NusB [Adonisia turfae CCMR0082]